VSYGRSIDIDSTYQINGVLVKNVDSIKDLGVTFDSKLRFDIHINEKVKKAYSMLGIINRNFFHMPKETFLQLYKSMVRSHLEYAHSV
jgi:hypothetical protein